jgi:hypothetical protein
MSEDTTVRLLKQILDVLKSILNHLESQADGR